MKKHLLLICFVFTFAKGFCQNIKIEEPEFAGVIIYANDTIGSGIKLEQQTSYIKAKTSGAAYIPLAGAFAKIKSKRYVKNCCSNVIVYGGSKIKFIAKVKDNSYDPSTALKLFKLVSDKETRNVEVGSASAVDGAKTSDIDFIPFIGKKYGISSYLVMIDKLEEGEYAFMFSDNGDNLYLFAVKNLSNNPERP